MDEHLADSIDIRAGSNLQRGISMPEAMEGDVLLDAGSSNPFAERVVHHASNETTKHFSISTLAAELQGFIADWEHRFCVRLLYPDADTIPKVGSQLYVIPCEIEYVADAQSRETGEQRGLFQHRNVARRGCQLLEFCGSEKLLAYIVGLNLLQKIVHIVLNPKFRNAII